MEGNVFLPCEIIQGTSERYGCYKDAALFAAQNEASVQELFTFIDESPKSWHSKEHAIGRAVLIASDYNLQLAGEKCAAAKRGCTSGYGHGLALSWGEYTKKTSPSDSDIEKNANVLMSFMETFCPLCYHYLGHYYGSVSDTIQQNLDNLDLCDSIIDDSKFLDCAMGVIHQHFQNKVPDVKNFFAKCQSHASTRKQEACYNHGSRYFARWYVRDTNIKGALSVCQELNKEVPPEWNWCYEGIGEWLFSKGITPDTSWCNALPAAVNEICRRDLTTPPQRALGRFDAELECDSKFGCQIPPGI